MNYFLAKKQADSSIKYAIKYYNELQNSNRKGEFISHYKSLFPLINNRNESSLRLLMNLSSSFEYVGDYKQVQMLLDLYPKLVTNKTSNFEQGLFYNNSGTFSQKKADYFLAESYFKKAIYFFLLDNSDKSIVEKINTINNLAGNYRNNQNSKEAFLNYKKADSLLLNYKNKDKLQNLTITVQSAFADFYLAENNLKQSKLYIDKTFQNYSSPKITYKKYFAFQLLSKYFLAKKEYKNAHIFADSSINNLVNRNLPKETGKVFLQKAEIFLAEKNKPKAIEYINKAIVYFYSKNKQIRFKRELLAGLILKSTLEKNTLKTHLQADSLIDFMRQEHTEQSSKLFWREKTRSFYENAIETCFRLKNPEKAFYFMEKSRAILLLDALKDLDASKILSDEQLATERSLRFATIGFQNKLDAIDEQDKNYKNYFQQLIEAKEKHQTFIKSIEKSNPNYYNLKYNNSYVSLQQIQAELKTSKQAFVQYFVGDSAVYALCIRAFSIDLKKINLQSFRDLSLKYLQLSALKPPHTVANLKQIQAVSFSLYQLIFEPFHISENRLVVSQDNVFIPFEALSFNQKSNQILLQKYAISYTYSANVLMRKQDKSWFTQNDLLGFAPQSFQKSLGLNSLMGSDKVLEKIEKQYFLGKTFFNQEATKEHFIQNASKYGIIQLFTHGKSDTISNESKIYFYDKSLSINELYQMNKLKAGLVVLSACETNLGQNATGEGVMSFARGFAYLNVPTTISTLWSVNNQSTYQLTEHFYQYLKAGFTKDEALQKAKLDYLKTSGNVYPYYWSGMVLIGETNSLEKNYLILILASLCILLVTIFVFYRRNNRFQSLK